MAKRTEPIFTIKFNKGLADRHRLPFSHVINVLEEVRRMISAVGREIQRESGWDQPTGDFGLELVAGRGGVVFKKGSVEANVAITADVQNGVLATQRVLGMVGKLSKPNASASVFAQDQVTHKVVRNLERIARIQEVDKTGSIAESVGRKFGDDWISPLTTAVRQRRGHVAIA